MGDDRPPSQANTVTALLDLVKRYGAACQAVGYARAIESERLSELRQGRADAFADVKRAVERLPLTAPQFAISARLAVIPPTPRVCKCLIPNWLELRAILKISQEAMALLSGCHRKTIYRLEHGPHHCARRSIQILTVANCQRPELKERLDAVGYRFTNELADREE